jgi:hypothetical protein
MNYAETVAAALRMFKVLPKNLPRREIPRQEAAG